MEVKTIGILTEKPSTAKDIATGLGCTKRGDIWAGTYEGNNVRITNCFGHLLELYSPEDYDKKYKSWNLGDLPIVPEFRKKPVHGAGKQLEIIKKTLSKVNEIIVATDPGREGEMIAAEVLKHLKLETIPARRFWTSSALTPEVVREALRTAKPLQEYAKLYKQGMVRAMIDWLFGMNYSRCLTILTNIKTSIGRVQTVILGLVYGRQKAHENFVSEKTFALNITIDCNGTQIPATYNEGEKNKFNSPDHLNQINQNLPKRGTVQGFTENLEVIHPQRLPNLNTIQQRCSKKYGYSPKKTLGICQQLYEHKKTSYPRTPSRAMNESDLPLMRKIFESFKKSHPKLFTLTHLDPNNQRIFKDADVEDHHALIPLDTFPPDNIDQLNVYNEIVLALAVALSPPAKRTHQKITSLFNEYQFKSHLKKYIQQGWKTIFPQDDNTEDDEPDDKLIAPPESNQPVYHVSSQIEEGKTTAPKILTYETLLGLLENPNSQLDENEDRYERGVGIGTPATRASIIENLEKKQYIRRNKNKLLYTAAGRAVIENVMNSSIKSISEIKTTAMWEKKLYEDPDLFWKEAVASLKEKIQQLTIEGDRMEKKEEHIIGVCPKCKAEGRDGKIRRQEKGWGCLNYFADPKCDFAIWKNQFGGQIDEVNAKLLIEGSKTNEMTFHKKTTKEPYTARLTLDPENNFNPTLVFPDKKTVRS